LARTKGKSSEKQKRTWHRYYQLAVLILQIIILTQGGSGWNRFGDQGGVQVWRRQGEHEVWVEEKEHKGIIKGGNDKIGMVQDNQRDWKRVRGEDWNGT